MKYQGKIQDPKDLVTKEYVDGRSGVTSVNGKSGDVEVSWEDIQNTPTTLSGYGITDAIGSNEKGANNGVATLGANGIVPSSQLPTIPTQVTEATVSGWGFTKNTGTVTTTGTMTANHVVVSNGGTVIKDSGFTIGKSVPSDAKFTDTTYESKSAASGGTAVSLVTTGEKYTWNNKGTYSKPSTGIPKIDLANDVQTSLGKADSALQSHQDISGKLDKSGGTMTGNLTVGSASIQTNGYIAGTWLQSTANNHLSSVATKFVVQDGSGWVYHRTASEMLNDLSAIPSSEKGANSGVATLDNSGKIPTTQIKQQIIISSTAPTTAQKFDNMLWYQIL